MYLNISLKRKPNLMHNLFLVYFINLYMFRAYLSPSSGGTTICIQQLVLIILFRWLSFILVALELIPIQPGQQTVWWYKMLAHKIQTLGIHPKEGIQQLQQGKRSKPRKIFRYYPDKIQTTKCWEAYYYKTNSVYMWDLTLQNAEWHISVTDSSLHLLLTLGSLATKSGIIVLVHNSQSGNFEASLLILIMSSSSWK
jgi:hypothetical protein